MLRSVVVDVTCLSPAVRREMYALFERYYQATTQPRFDRDMSEKKSAVLIYDAAERLCGFSTLAVRSMMHEDRAIRVVFSGDTIIDRAHWGSQAFAFSWIRQIGKIAGEAPGVPLYWLLTAKGPRTFRYLPAFGLEFVPNWRGAGDPELEKLKDMIAVKFFGLAYDHTTGLVRYEQSQGHLTTEWAMVSEREGRRPDVRFFLARNPGYVKGDELVCLCELKEDNMRPLTRRLFQKGLAS